MRTLYSGLPKYAPPVVMCLIAGSAVQGAAGVSIQAQAADTILYSFTGKADGQSPAADLVLDPKRNLYGTTTGAGSSGNGVVFQLSPSRKETVLHLFGSVANDGSDPQAGLVFDTKGRALRNNPWAALADAARYSS